MNDEKLDLSALDPARDAAAWERRIREVVARAVSARRWTVSGQLSSWARPALALAAAAALFSGIGLVLAGGSLDEAKVGSATEQEAPSSVLSRWAASGEQPSASRLLTVLGEK